MFVFFGKAFLNKKAFCNYSICNKYSNMARRARATNLQMGSLANLLLFILLACFVLMVLRKVAAYFFTKKTAMNTAEYVAVVQPVEGSEPLSARPVQQENVLEEKEFSWLNEDISYGNPISWSNKPNAGVVVIDGMSNFRPGQSSLCNAQIRSEHSCGTEVVIQGHSVPLANELYASRRDEETIVPFANLRASPECCPATFSTDAGCVCGL